MAISSVHFVLRRERKFFDLILSKSPLHYPHEIGSLAKEVRDYEPIVALDGGEDGLEFYRRLHFPSAFLFARRGMALLEIGRARSSRF